MFARVRRTGLIFAIGLGACAREPVGEICPAVLEGQLIVTEIRGAQTGGDTYGQWVEIYNDSGGDLDLEGLHVVFTRMDGGASARAIVRRPLPLAAGSYAVIGRAPDDMRPARTDYGMGTDFPSAWFTSGSIEVQACGATIDRVTYTSLPTMGTRALRGAPDPTANDTEANWCIDTEPNTDTTQLGLPGSPGEANPSC